MTEYDDYDVTDSQYELGNDAVVFDKYSEVDNSDFAKMVSQIKAQLDIVDTIENIYKKRSCIQEKSEIQSAKGFIKWKFIVKLFGVILVVLMIGFVFVSTLDSTDLYSLLDDHIYSLSVITDMVTFDFDDAVQTFANTMLVALFDAMALTLVITILIVLYKLILRLINAIRISSLDKKGRKIIRKKLSVIDGYPARYICSLAMIFIVGCYKRGQATDFLQAKRLFDEFVRTPEGLREVGKTVPWLHDMRIGLEKEGFR